MAQANPIIFGYYTTADMRYDLINYVNEQDYTINQVEEFQTWTDANWIDYRDFVRTRIEGTVTLGFSNEATYQSVLAALRSAVRANGTIKLYAYVNNMQTSQAFFAFVDIVGAGKWDRHNSRQWQTLTLSVRER